MKDTHAEPFPIHQTAVEVRYESDHHVDGNGWRPAGAGLWLTARPAAGRLQDNYRRRPCSAVVKFNDAVTLLDAGIPHLMDDWPAGSFQQFCYPLPYGSRSGLFPALGRGATIPVYGPPDDAGCDDLFKHPGILDFSHRVEPFVMFELPGSAGHAAAAQPFETDLRVFAGIGSQPRGTAFRYRRTAGKTVKFLLNNQPQAIIIDCSHEPRENAAKPLRLKTP